ncbi:hypothetical protein GCM10010255_82710 [Streptomyces coeruleofuscus]|uniref:DUF305 domain-containing protein n=1 Tax=Streptomyces coeruleofuscus TaxID=66879 RepID=A0ABP5WHH7_9ACTN
MRCAVTWPERAATGNEGPAVQWIVRLSMPRRRAERRGLRLWHVWIVLPLAFVTAISIAVSGMAFDSAFMEVMIKHHEGAVAMAKTGKTEGAFPGAKKMAGAIITSQTAEITRMNGLLARADHSGSGGRRGPDTPPLPVTLHHLHRYTP